jgi:uncharacterized RDD family membrane protein YckC
MFPSLSLLWSRLLAFAVDYLFIALYLLLLVGVGALIRLTPLCADFGALFANPASAELTSFILLVLPVLLYFALMESSRWQATIGKRVVGLRVMTMGGGRVGFPRSLLRNALKLIPWELAHACLWRIPGWSWRSTRLAWRSAKRGRHPTIIWLACASSVSAELRSMSQHDLALNEMM